MIEGFKNGSVPLQPGGTNVHLLKSIVSSIIVPPTVWGLQCDRKEGKRKVESLIHVIWKSCWNLIVSTEVTMSCVTNVGLPAGVTRTTPFSSCTRTLDPWDFPLVPMTTRMELPWAGPTLWAVYLMILCSLLPGSVGVAWDPTLKPPGIHRRGFWWNAKWGGDLWGREELWCSRSGSFDQVVHLHYFLF